MKYTLLLNSIKTEENEGSMLNYCLICNMGCSKSPNNQENNQVEEEGGKKLRDSTEKKKIRKFCRLLMCLHMGCTA